MLFKTGYALAEPVNLHFFHFVRGFYAGFHREQLLIHGANFIGSFHGQRGVLRSNKLAGLNIFIQHLKLFPHSDILFVILVLLKHIANTKCIILCLLESLNRFLDREILPILVIVDSVWV